MLPQPTGPPAERRATARRVLLRPCLVRFDRRYLDGRAGSVGFAAEVQDLSPGGVGLLMKSQLPPGADLAVQPVDRERPDLPPARVIHCVPCGARWRHGCALGRRLTDEAFQDWLI